MEGKGKKNGSINNNSNSSTATVLKTGAFQFDVLPKSVLAVIYGYLDSNSVAALSRSNKSLNTISREQTWYQKIYTRKPLKMENPRDPNNNNLIKEVGSPLIDYSTTRKISNYLRNHESMKWKLNQVFGEDPTAVNEENVITTVEFDPTGEFLSIGYQCGQVVVFRNSSGDTFKFHTQFESHTSEFDFLTSLEIEEKINKIKWVRNKYFNNSRMLLSTNDKTIKLWKMYEKSTRSSLGSSSGSTEVTQRKLFANAHAYNINSVSLCSDGENFISADDLRVNLWNLENGSECFTIVDCKPPNMNELNEVITASEFHPQHCSLFSYATSKGVVKLADMRHQALCDRAPKVYTDKKEKKSFFSEVIGSISDVKYSSDGRYILARDYLKLKIWDVNMESEPVKVFDVHEYVKSKLYELYENDGLFDKFECCFSPSNLHVLTGSYSNNFAVFDTVTSEVKYSQAVNPRERRKRKPANDTLNFGEKILHTAWHPHNDLVAIAAQNYIYLYHLAKA